MRWCRSTPLAVGPAGADRLVLLRADLVDSWRKATPPDAPNRFVINVQPDQSEAFQAGSRPPEWSGLIGIP